MSSTTFEVYASQLAHYRTEDIAAVVNQLMFKRREQGETAFPDLPTLHYEIRTFVFDRARREEKERERREEEAEEQHRRDHPEEYVHVRDILANFMKTRGMEVLPPKKVESPVCEHCRGVRLDLLSAKELRDLADVVEQREQMQPKVRSVA